jgi:hypothetical protein
MALETLERRPWDVIGDRRTIAVAAHVRRTWRILARRRRRSMAVAAATTGVVAVLAGALPTLAVALLASPLRQVPAGGMAWPVAVGALLAVSLLVLAGAVTRQEPRSRSR